MNVRFLLALAFLGLAILALAVFPSALAQSWLAAALIVIGIPLGAMWILPIYSYTGGQWGKAIAPVLRPMVLLLAPATLLLVPLLPFLGHVFPWADVPPESLSEMVRNKLAVLNTPGLMLRLLIYVAAWAACSFMLVLWPLGAQGEDRLRRERIAGAPVLAVHALITTGFCTDWLMALDPEFNSTVFAMTIASANACAALAVAMAILHWQKPLTERRPSDTPPLSRDLGKLLLAGLLFWAYVAYMQFLIIWSGNLPYEITYYLRRLDGGGVVLLIAAITCFCIIPSALLIGPWPERSNRLTSAVLALVLFGYTLNTIWHVAPGGWSILVLAFLLFMLVAAAALFSTLRSHLTHTAERKEVAHG